MPILDYCAENKMQIALFGTPEGSAYRNDITPRDVATSDIRGLSEKEWKNLVPDTDCVPRSSNQHETNWTIEEVPSACRTKNEIDNNFTDPSKQQDLLKVIAGELLLLCLEKEKTKECNHPPDRNSCLPEHQENDDCQLSSQDPFSCKTIIPQPQLGRVEGNLEFFLDFARKLSLEEENHGIVVSECEHDDNVSLQSFDSLQHHHSRLGER